MKSTELLGREHHWIEGMLDCLEALVAGARRRRRLDAEAAAELLYLLESFADGQHQEKEEVLLPSILDCASEVERSELQSLLEEHVAEREQMERLRARLGDAIAGRSVDVKRFVKAAREYLALHRSHVQQENLVLLPLAERALTPEQDQAVVEGFRRLEADGPDPRGVGERVAALCRRLNVTGGAV